MPIRFLIVDDEQTVGRMVGAAMKTRGWESKTAVSVAQAQTLIETEHFDGFLFDKNLPDGSGVDLIKPARARNPHAVCVLFTAFSSSQSAREALRLGIDAYIEKPFEDLFKVVERLADLIKIRTEALSSQPVTARPIHVLVVSPDQDCQNWLRERLEAERDKVTCMNDSGNALTFAREQHPDLIILDANLRNPDVASFLSWVNVPGAAVITRQSAATREIVEYIDLNVKAVLEKPLNDHNFTDEMAGLLWRLRTRRR